MNLKNQLTKSLISIEELMAVRKAVTVEEVQAAYDKMKPISGLDASKKLSSMFNVDVSVDPEAGKVVSVRPRRERMRRGDTITSPEALRRRYEDRNKGDTLIDIAPQYANQTLANRLRDQQEEK